jgi:hypothetical protein
MGRLCSTKGGEASYYRILIRKPEGKRKSGRLSVKWDNNIKTHCLELGWTGKDWVDLAQNWDRWQAVLNIVMNIKWGSFLTS